MPLIVVWALLASAKTCCEVRGENRACELLCKGVGRRLQALWAIYKPPHRVHKLRQAIGASFPRVAGRNALKSPTLRGKPAPYSARCPRKPHSSSRAQPRLAHASSTRSPPAAAASCPRLPPPQLFISHGRGVQLQRGCRPAGLWRAAGHVPAGGTRMTVLTARQAGGGCASPPRFPFQHFSTCSRKLHAAWGLACAAAALPCCCALPACAPAGPVCHPQFEAGHRRRARLRLGVALFCGGDHGVSAGPGRAARTRSSYCTAPLLPARPRSPASQASLRPPCRPPPCRLALKYVLQRTISNAMFIATAYIGWGQLLITPAVRMPCPVLPVPRPP